MYYNGTLTPPCNTEALTSKSTPTHPHFLSANNKHLVNCWCPVANILLLSGIAWQSISKCIHVLR